jgi:hypothetical protein
MWIRLYVIRNNEIKIFLFIVIWVYIWLNEENFVCTSAGTINMYKKSKRKKSNRILEHGTTYKYYLLCLYSSPIEIINK